VLNDYRMVILGVIWRVIWAIISKVPPIPSVFGEMGFKKDSQEWSFGVIWGHLGYPGLQPSSGWALQIAKVEG
jgi:hypothetical protein